MLVRSNNTILRELLELVSKKRNMLFSPININFFSNYNDELWFTSSLSMLTGKRNSKNLKDIVGSSANAVIALLFGLGHTTKEIQHKLNDITFYQSLINTGSKNYKPLSITVGAKPSTIKTTLRRKQFKLSATDCFFKWVQEQISNKLVNPMATFEDLNVQGKKQACFKNIHLIGLNIETGKLEIFNCKNTPDMPLAIAVRICMSCSTTFSIVKIIDSTTHTNKVYVDGGLVLQHIDLRKYKIAS